jgi:hypothetical protein
MSDIRPARAAYASNSILDTRLLRVSATLVFVGELLFIAVGIFHPAREDPNNHAAVFAEYAMSTLWGAVHLGQFVTMAVILAGLVSLLFALNLQSDFALYVGRCGAVSAVLALALTGVLQAVDGVALKQTVDAWAVAPATEQAARFASAETIRWLEWAIRSYQRLMLGVTLALYASVILSTARLPRPIGLAMAISALAYIAQGVIVGSEGFSPRGTGPQLLVGRLTAELPKWSRIR